jgi:hypothetical protein
MVDMINPSGNGYLTMQDLVKEERRTQSGSFVLLLFLFK